MRLNKRKKIIFNKKQRASAIMLVMFILSGVMIIVFSSSSIVLSGLKMGKIQSESTIAYFAAESGAEILLYEFRKDNLMDKLGTPPENNILSSSVVNTNYVYTVNYDAYIPLTFTSIGSYYRTRRSVEISFY